MDTKNQQTLNQQGEEDYIDMEVSSSSLLCNFNHIRSPTHCREFEFQMCLTPSFEEREISSPSPADELFYNGKLLPLHLPPRLQMVEKLILQYSNTESKPSSFTARNTTVTTPFESRNTSPSQSCRVSCELNRNDYLFSRSTEMNSSSCSVFNQQPERKCWPKKLKLIKQSIVAQTLRASKIYLKSLFGKPGCSTDTVEETSNKKNDSVKNQYMKVSKQNSIFDKIDGCNSNNAVPDRRSFSGAIKQHCGVKCMSPFSSSSPSNCSSNSSSFSDKSDGFYELNMVNTSSKTHSEIENAIEGAIAHCKKSQQLKEQQCATSASTKGSGSSLLLKQEIAGCGHLGRPEHCRM